MKNLKRITVIGLGLLGGSVVLAAWRAFNGIKTTAYTHRASTRKKAKKLGHVCKLVDNIKDSVLDCQLVILATPICTFEDIFSQISGCLPKGCIVTDVGSTKALPHRWAAEILPKNIRYVGSHPIAGSEQRGVEFARDDLFDGTICILTKTSKTDHEAIAVLEKFWTGLGCSIKSMRPAEHDRIFAKISHLPHITAAALINSNSPEVLKFAGKGFIDTSRIASGPANIWADILFTNADNCVKGIDKIIAELQKFKKTIKTGNKKQIQTILEKARDKRNELIRYKVKEKELPL